MRFSKLYFTFFAIALVTASPVPEPAPIDPGTAEVVAMNDNLGCGGDCPKDLVTSGALPSTLSAARMTVVLTTAATAAIAAIINPV